ncbi:response regulator [Mariniflexile litorale]|uniref:Response regulator n=1 Tax=Mariniflexile litorale TaxID=3045158 RepID=A0AAU7EF05_9FLAO|nr:response regulator [Mariniflexile sp. KMM 9835]MDQ8213186.1 response regulator [Mariniflexile sp. KMM 9835]
MNKILLIDDNSTDNYINKLIIEKANITNTIIVQTSPVEALNYLKNVKGDFPEFIFLDIKMPEMDGFDFLKAYDEFEDDKKRNIHIIMLTSSHNMSDVEKANENPYVKKYLIKPLDALKLNDTLEAVFS